MEHDDNEHWWLAEYSKGDVGYVPVSYMMMIVYETVQGEGCDKTRKEGHGKRTHGTKIGGEKGRDGERRKSYSAAVIYGIKRNSTVYVGYSKVWNTDSTLNKDKDIIVRLRRGRIEHVTEIV